MGVSAGAPQKLRFGVFEVDLREAQLSKHGRPVRIQSQPFQILALLLERGDEIVTREELRRKLDHARETVDVAHFLPASRLI